jgi:hypothetical protein
MSSTAGKSLKAGLAPCAWPAMDKAAIWRLANRPGAICDDRPGCKRFGAIP